MAERLGAKGHTVAVSTQWVVVPSVTATAKLACSPEVDQPKARRWARTSASITSNQTAALPWGAFASCSTPRASKPLNPPAPIRTARSGRKKASWTS